MIKEADTNDGASDRASASSEAVDRDHLISELSTAATRPPQLANIGLARVRGDVAPNAARGVTASFTGPLDTVSGDLVPLAFIKDLTLKELTGELLGACIGSALGLPIPPAFLVVAEQNQGPWVHAPIIGANGERLLFATAAVTSPTTLFAYANKPSSRALERLVSWQHFSGSVAFDEWIANIDRHGGNLLVSGDGSFWLIDHTHILTGSRWVATSLEAQAKDPFRNQLTEYTLALLSSADRIKQRDAAVQAASSHSIVDVPQMLSVYPLGDLLLPSDRSAVLSFLQERRDHTRTLLQGRFL